MTRALKRPVPANGSRKMGCLPRAGCITQAEGHRSNLRKRRMNVIHDPAQVIAFVTFSAVVAGTPGPSNALLTAIGARAGARQGLASLLGQVTGMGAMLFAITLGLGNVLLAHPPGASSTVPWRPCWPHPRSRWPGPASDHTPDPACPRSARAQAIPCWHVHAEAASQASGVMLRKIWSKIAAHCSRAAGGSSARAT